MKEFKSIDKIIRNSPFEKEKTLELLNKAFQKIDSNANKEM